LDSHYFGGKNALSPGKEYFKKKYYQYNKHRFGKTEQKGPPRYFHPPALKQAKGCDK
jgi:hypothetical protein